MIRKKMQLNKSTLTNLSFKRKDCKGFAKGAKKCLKRQPARRSTKAEFLLPNAMQFATACSMAARRPDCGT